MEVFVEKRRRAQVYTFDPTLLWDGPGQVYKAPNAEKYIFVDPTNNIPRAIEPGMVVVVRGVRAEVMARGALEKDWELDLTAQPADPGVT